MTDAVLLLLVEDDPTIRLTLEDELEEAGFKTLTAPTGQDAIDILDTHQAELAGLITDIRLGNGPDGWAVAHHARQLNPLLPIVYMSGDSAAEWPVKGVPKSTMLQKPYASMQVVVAISTLLNEIAPPAP